MKSLSLVFIILILVSSFAFGASTLNSKEKNGGPSINAEPLINFEFALELQG